MKSAEHQILTRIGFAECWLQRAREECLDGDVARGLLTLVLADAEVRRVLQLAVPHARRTPSPWLPALAGVVGLIVAVAAVQFGALTLGAASVQSAAPAPGLTLRAGIGALLEPIEASVPQLPVQVVTDVPTPATPAVATRRPLAGELSAAAGSAPVFALPARPAPLAPVAQPVPSAGPASSAEPVSIAQPVPPGAPTASLPPAEAPIPAVSSAPTHAVTLSTVDLLDLVIVADRTLRRSQP